MSTAAERRRAKILARAANKDAKSTIRHAMDEEPSSTDGGLPSSGPGPSPSASGKNTNDGDEEITMDLNEDIKLSESAKKSWKTSEAEAAPSKSKDAALDAILDESINPNATVKLDFESNVADTINNDHKEKEKSVSTPTGSSFTNSSKVRAVKNIEDMDSAESATPEGQNKSFRPIAARRKKIAERRKREEVAALAAGGGNDDDENNDDDNNDGEISFISKSAREVESEIAAIKQAERAAAGEEDESKSDQEQTPSKDEEDSEITPLPKSGGLYKRRAEMRKLKAKAKEEEGDEEDVSVLIRNVMKDVSPTKINAISQIVNKKILEKRVDPKAIPKFIRMCVIIGIASVAGYWSYLQSPSAVSTIVMQREHVLYGTSTPSATLSNNIKKSSSDNRLHNDEEKWDNEEEDLESILQNTQQNSNGWLDFFSNKPKACHPNTGAIVIPTQYGDVETPTFTCNSAQSWLFGLLIGYWPNIMNPTAGMLLVSAIMHFVNMVLTNSSLDMTKRFGGKTSKKGINEWIEWAWSIYQNGTEFIMQYLLDYVGEYMLYILVILLVSTALSYYAAIADEKTNLETELKFLFLLDQQAILSLLGGKIHAILGTGGEELASEL